MKRSTIILATAVILIVAVGAAYFAGNNGNALTSSSSTALKGQIQVVAAENFWGSLVSQVGGSKVNVTSIVSDPNTDPHEYESNTANARAIAGASLVIINGAGYDTWAQSLIQASNTPSQVVLNVQLLLKQPIDTNPHFWYSPYFVNDTVNAMYRDLVTIDPTDSSYFRQQYTALNSSLWSSYMMQEEIIRRQFGGAPVASTESIFVYMANATGLNLITPPAFMKEVAEGGEPSPGNVATFENQLNGGNSTVRVLVYNEQTVTQFTQSLIALAAKNEIPCIRISETIQPPNFTFQAWMEGEVGQLQNALDASALGQ